MSKRFRNRATGLVEIVENKTVISMMENAPEIYEPVADPKPKGKAKAKAKAKTKTKTK